MTASFTFHNTKLAILPDQLRLLRKDPVRKMHRYYFMTVQRDLFGGASLVREWGRVGQAGKVRCIHFPNEAHAVSALVEIAKTKIKRGYCGLGFTSLS
jgi:predicted DNA-binding WGR domain protein